MSGVKCDVSCCVSDVRCDVYCCVSGVMCQALDNVHGCVRCQMQWSVLSVRC